MFSSRTPFGTMQRDHVSISEIGLVHTGLERVSGVERGVTHDCRSDSEGDWPRVEDLGPTTQKRDLTIPMDTFVDHCGGLVMGGDGQLSGVHPHVAVLNAFGRQRTHRC